MEQRLTIITLGVSDLKEATDFYELKFGWTKSGASNEHISFFLLNGIYLSLYNKAELAEDVTISNNGNGFRGFTLAYNTRSENEVDQIIETLRSREVKIIKEPQKVSWGGYSSYVSDLDGNLWEIAYNPYLELDIDGSVTE